MRQMHMEVERRNAGEPPPGIQIPRRVERNEPGRSLNRGGAKAPTVFDRHTKPLDERSCVPSEALLSRNERIAMMRILHGALLQIGGIADVMVRSKDETGSFAAEKMPDCLYLFLRGLLFG